MTRENKIIQKTKEWLNGFVIEYNLCPFAKKPFVQEKIRYTVYDGTDLAELAMILQKELLYLNDSPNSKLETTLIILSETLQDFNDYLDFLDVGNRLIFALRLEGVLQIASFHPKYQFEGTSPEDVTNFTNRSPFPLIHLLREDSISEALKNYKHPEEIPERNMKLMVKLRKEGKI